MEIENKLDQDFLFYLGFTNKFLECLDTKDVEKCRDWLKKLCGEPCLGVRNKRNRNIYLSNLLLSMQDGVLSEPFQGTPNEVDISNAMQVFGSLPTTVSSSDILENPNEVMDNNDHDTRDGRTYLATRTLPDGEGAFAYLAVTLADDEPRWVGGGERVLEAYVDEKPKELTSPISEVEQLLLQGKSPTEREKVVSFYDTLLHNINRELEDEICEEDNDIVNGLIEQLTNDLRRRGQYIHYEALTPKHRRVQLLLILHERVHARMLRILHREEDLDDVPTKILPSSFTDIHDISNEEQGRVDLPGPMWEEAINKQPSKKNMNALFEKYPHVLIEKFLDLLVNEKEEIAVRMQRRHENIIAETRKDIQIEHEKIRVKVEEAEHSLSQALPVLSAVKAAYLRQLNHTENIDKKKRGEVPENHRLYEKIMAALHDTRRNVEEEELNGRMLVEQINDINTKTNLQRQLNSESIRSTESENAWLMQNIKRLRSAIQEHESRVQQNMDAYAHSKQPSNEDFCTY